MFLTKTYLQCLVVFNKKLKMLNCKQMKTDDARRAIDNPSHSGGIKIEKKKEIMTLSYKMFWLKGTTPVGW